MLCNKVSFEQKFSALKKNSSGNIIAPAPWRRHSWFRFRENMLRGYVRMRAEQHGLELDFQNYRVAGEHSARASDKFSSYKPLTSVEGRVAGLRGDNDWPEARKQAQQDRKYDFQTICGQIFTSEES